MADKFIERSFRFDYGIETIIENESESPTLPENRAAVRPINESKAIGVELLHRTDNLESYILGALSLSQTDDEWLFPGRFRRGLQDIRTRIAAAGKNGASCFEDDTWRQVVKQLDLNDRMLEMVYIYQSTLQQV